LRFHTVVIDWFFSDGCFAQALSVWGGVFLLFRIERGYLEVLVLTFLLVLVDTQNSLGRSPFPNAISSVVPVGFIPPCDDFR